jgi:hypothetical protein
MKENNRTAFECLVANLRTFKLKCAPVNEAEIENGVEKFLKMKRFLVRNQVVIEKERFDLAVGKFIIEVKIIGQRKVVEQLDRYSAFCEGLILLCWKATSPVKKVFALAKSRSKIPIELIEVSKNCDLV